MFKIPKYFRSIGCSGHDTTTQAMEAKGFSRRGMENSMVHIICRTRLAWLLFVTFTVMSGCKSSSSTEGSVIVEITSTSAVDNLEIKIRNQAYKATFTKPT